MPGVFQMCQARLGKAWSRSGNTAPIVIAPDGGPWAGWTPASQRRTLLGLSHSRPGLHCQGRARDVFPSWQSGARAGAPGLVLQAWEGEGGRGEGGALLDPILMSNCDYTTAPELMLVTCGPKQSRECCLFMVLWADLSPLYCCLLYMTNEYQHDQRLQQWWWCDADGPK